MELSRIREYIRDDLLNRGKKEYWLFEIRYGRNSTIYHAYGDFILFLSECHIVKGKKN